MSNRSATCAQCGKELDISKENPLQPSTPCPECGSIAQNIKLSIFDKIETHECLKGKVKDKEFSSKKNPRKEFISGDEIRKSDGKWMKKYRLIDKDKNLYIEEVIDPETGDQIHYKNEELKKHTGHGSAKFNQNDKS